jgi:hypothetical protein
MRTQLLCALAFLFGAEVAHAQGWGTNTYNNYYGYPASYQASGGYDYTSAYGSAGYYPYANGYDYTSYYANSYYGGYPVSTGMEVPSTAPATAPVEGVPTEGVPEGEGFPDVEPACKYKCWLIGDYIMSWVRPMHFNYPLVTIGSVADVPAGGLGQPGTTVVVGGQDLNLSAYSGFRIEGGCFLDDHRHWSVEAIAQYVGEKTINFNFQSDANGNPLIARPIFNVVTNNNRAFPDSFPGLASGGATVDFRSEIYSTEINAAYSCYTPAHETWSALVGFRYAHLAESLTVTDRLNPLVAGAFTFGGNTNPVNPPDTLQDMDNFRTNNNFYGIQFGGKYRWDTEWIFISAFAKIAVGVNSQVVDINGSSTQITPAGNTTLQGGILALPTNIGHHTRTVFAILPEGGINIGLKLTHNISASVGYTGLFWTQVVRPGRQIDGGVNPTLVPTDFNFGNPTGTLVGPSRPIFTSNSETLWVQSLTFGLEFVY